MYHLEAEDLLACESMYAGILKSVANENIIGNVLYSYESTLSSCGNVCRQNIRICADQQPNKINT